MNETRLAKIEARTNEATDGPWTLGDELTSDWHLISGVDHYSNGIEVRTTVCGNYDYEEGGVVNSYDATFIAAARQDVPDLCQALHDAWNALRVQRELWKRVGSQVMDPKALAFNFERIDEILGDEAAP